MSRHVLIITPGYQIGGEVECSDPVWAKNQYSPANIRTLSDIEGVFNAPDDFQVQVPRTLGSSDVVWLKAKKLCEDCKTAILWDRVISLQDRIEAMEERLGNLS